ncbi:MAG: 30S ribosomal protein S16 [Chloroflexi bacterium]|nr:30S ribosomal protein S16 [Chloroflexota bacterium]
MVKIRLRRTGAKKKPSYRVVVADSRAPREGAFIEIIGHYNPLTDPPTIVIEKDKALAWIGKGAQPTETTARLLSKVGVIDASSLPAPRQAVTQEKPRAAKEPEPETEEKK